MRLPAFAFLAVLLAAGCAAPEEPERNPLFGLCPQWQADAFQQAASVELAPGIPRVSQVLAPATYELDGLAFDMVRLHVTAANVTGGSVALTASAGPGSGATVNLWDFRPAASPTARRSYVPEVSFHSGADDAGATIEAYLTSVVQDERGEPGPVRLDWTARGNVTASIAYTATFHYKVCGAAQGGETRP